MEQTTTIQTFQEVVAPAREAMGKYKALQESIKKHEATIARLEKRADKQFEKGHLIAILERLGETLLPYFPGYNFVEVSGPFGLGSQCCLKLTKTKPERHARHNPEEKNIFMAFEMFNWEDVESISFRDFTRNTKVHAPGTIASYNDMNYPLVDITNMTIEEIVAEVKRVNSDIV